MEHADVQPEQVELNTAQVEGWFPLSAVLVRITFPLLHPLYGDEEDGSNVSISPGVSVGVATLDVSRIYGIETLSVGGSR